MKKLFFALGFLVCVHFSNACQCIIRPTDTLYKKSEFVFVGELVKIEFVFFKKTQSGENESWEAADTVEANQQVIDTTSFSREYMPMLQLATFKIKTWFKGALPKDSMIHVSTGMGSGDCGVNFYTSHYTIHQDSAWFKNPEDIKKMKKHSFVVFAVSTNQKEEFGKIKTEGLYTDDCWGTEIIADKNAKTAVLEKYLQK